jgi:hypothetical protein
MLGEYPNAGDIFVLCINLPAIVVDPGLTGQVIEDKTWHTAELWQNNMNLSSNLAHTADYLGSITWHLQS